MQVGDIQLGDEEPKWEGTALGLVLAHPLTRGEGPRGTGAPHRSALGSAGNKARVREAGRLRGARCILGLVSTVTHVHPTQPRSGLQVPAFRGTAFPLHTRRLVPDPKGNP